MLGLATATVRAAPLRFVHGQGSRVVDDAGKPLILRGCNLGNWLIIESWMLGWDVADQETMIRTLTQRFGAAEADRLVTMYRDGYIGPRDFAIIKSFNFNLVRVPFDSRMVIDGAGNVRPDGFKWLDRALDLAEQAGVYVILDMHGAPGSQSKQDHTGQRDVNQLWSDPANQSKMVELWKRIAERYKDRSVVAAYDLLNEPYGDFQTDYRGPLRELMPRCYQAIRSAGDKHLVIFPNGLGTGPTFYDDPKAAGMNQVAFTDHYYAGLFGSPSTIRSHAAMFERTMPEAQAFLDHVGSPMLIGEFNVVLSKAGGKPMMRRYYDEFARRGWMATMWSYKSLKPAAGMQDDNWYLATNAQSLPAINIATSSRGEIESYFAQLGTMPLAIDEPLRAILTSDNAPPIALPKLDALPDAAPAARSDGAWKLADIGTARPSGVSVSDGKLSIVATGTDIIGEHDSFSFLQQPASKQATLIATIDRLADSDTWAKAGLMIRFGETSSPGYAAAPFVMINTFTDGGFALVMRDRAGARATECKHVLGPLPRRFALVRDGKQVDAYADDGAQSWVKIGSATVNGDATAQIGMAVCSHRGGAFTKADFKEVALTNSAALPGAVKQHAAPQIAESASQLLKNPTFADKGDSTPVAAGWNQWGEGFDREARAISWQPGRGESGLWQDVKVKPGTPYRFAVRVRRGEAGPPAETLTLSLEATMDGKQIALAERTVDASQLESDDGWSVVQIEATAVTDLMRPIIRVGGGDVHDGGFTFSDASLSRVPQ